MTFFRAVLVQEFNRDENWNKGILKKSNPISDIYHNEFLFKHTLIIKYIFAYKGFETYWQQEIENWNLRSWVGACQFWSIFFVWAVVV